ncbi:MAG: ribokinase [Thermoguttaceae bacterium]
MKKPRIIVVGSSNVDMVVKSDRIPSPGETVTGGEFLLAAGGKGANQAVAAAKLGAEVLFITRVGNDMFGDQALAGYKEVGINTDWAIKDTEHPTGVALIMVDEKGENLISVASGANSYLSPHDVEKAEKEFSTADVVVVQLETPLNTLVYTAKLAKKYSVPLLLDPAPAPPTPFSDSLMQNIACIKPNENEAWRLTGIKVNDQQSAQAAADSLLKQGVKSAIITLGTQGALVVEELHKGVLVPAEVVKALDTTAAGDAFSGALAVAWGGGKSLIDAAKFASKAAAISVTRMGAQPSLPTLDELS